jgi:hypothetical protein
MMTGFDVDTAFLPSGAGLFRPSLERTADVCHLLQAHRPGAQPFKIDGAGARGWWRRGDRTQKTAKTTPYKVERLDLMSIKEVIQYNTQPYIA